MSTTQMVSDADSSVPLICKLRLTSPEGLRPASCITLIQDSDHGDV